MADRVKPMGMDRALISKEASSPSKVNSFRSAPLRRQPSADNPYKRMGAKYDSGLEYEVRGWIKQLIGEDIGEGPSNVEKSLRDGVILCNLMKKVIDGTPSESLPAACAKTDLKSSPSELPFKQMENIEKFLKAAHKYGVPNTSLFQTVELYEARNLPMVLATISHVGTEAQRHNYQGPTIGSKPTEKHQVQFSYEQLKQSHGTIGLQSGTNKFATQKGMRIGSIRHISDIKADDLLKEGNTLLTLQAGTNRFASQKGMTGFGAVRHIADIRADQFDKDGENIITLQAGTNKFASQKGMTGFGAVRHVSDIRADDFDPATQSHIGLQAGSNQFASQKGMTGFGAVRHICDIRADDLDREAQAEIPLQYGTNRGASQRGMTSFGSQRHIADIKVSDLAEDMKRQDLNMTPKEYQAFRQQMEATEQKNEEPQYE
ncbi:calponin-1-like isoform X4 [Mytilus californianus]|uniref:calponin-1-like isoform X4 n=1 Tax=Mytilus californianus TaxID=6549 RepID=UPI0022466381|nr:calponin-1-like isoform X4 [Mytilus californianus]